MSPCPSNTATDVVAGEKKAFTSADLTSAKKARVDLNWLAERVHGGRAVVAAKFKTEAAVSGGTEIILDASQVFVKLPESPSCPQFKLAACAAGEAHTFTRDQNRCQVPTGCAKTATCSTSVPACTEGYTLQSWSSLPKACPAYACDPTWAVAQAQ